jgi:subtilisin family serine protease
MLNPGKFLVLLLLIVDLYSCKPHNNPHPSANWQNKDLYSDGIFGISADKAYEQLLANRPAKTVLVAVIDSGIDTTQADLQGAIWTDPADGSHGRNYLVQETGKEDFILMLAKFKTSPGYNRTLADYHVHVQRLIAYITELKESKVILDLMLRHMGKREPTLADFKAYQPLNESERRIADMVIARFGQYPDFSTLQYQEVDHPLALSIYHAEHGLSWDSMGAEADPNTGVNAYPNTGVNADADTGVNPSPPGFNTDISADPPGLTADPNDNPAHGTYMSGIIAAARNNTARNNAARNNPTGNNAARNNPTSDTNVQGISDHAQIMMIKVFNNIREARDTYIAAAIHYAADHGARIISMSIGKTFSLHKDLVDQAVKYAMSKDVLIIHSAGNNGMNLETDSNAVFPSPKYLDGGVAPAWITVGASGYSDDSTLIPPFSNYGRTQVDVFAPGVQITSITPHGGLATWDGTSQATAVVAGLATLVRSYYPQLTAMQVKEVIMNSVVKRDILSNKCLSGGVVNAFRALQLAASYK